MLPPPRSYSRLTIILWATNTLLEAIKDIASHPGHKDKPQETETILNTNKGHCKNFQLKHHPHYRRRQQLYSRAPAQATGD
ncbi:UNVERIFIED_CONTAM: hypothetical protein K2H54_054931 [Gekko kuhli]